MSPKEGAREERIKILEHEVKGLRLQIAMKQEILERLINETDSLYTLIENMREREREQDLRIEALEKDVHSKQQSSPNTGNRPSELSPSCKITQFAGRR